MVQVKFTEVPEAGKYPVVTQLQAETTSQAEVGVPEIPKSEVHCCKVTLGGV